MKCKRCPNEARPGKGECAECAAKRRSYDKDRYRSSGVAPATAEEEAKALQWLIERGYRSARGETR